jgi:Tsi6
MVDERLSAAPSPVYDSIRNQLVYLAEVVAAEMRPSEEKLDSLTLGVYAAREFETSDPKFADVLFQISYLANRL